MRPKVLAAAVASLMMVGCATYSQDVYDEQAVQECYEILNTEAQRACLSEVEDKQERGG